MKQALLVTSVVVALFGILLAPSLLSPVVAARCEARGGTVVEVPGELPLCVRK
jgi:hypothetical protein